MPELGPEGQTIYQMADDSTGMKSGALSFLAVPLSLAHLPTPKKTVQARQYTVAAGKTLIEAFSSNKKYPIKQTEYIRKEIGLLPTFFDTPELFRERAESIARFLRNSIESWKVDALDDSLDMDKKIGALNAISDANKYLWVLGAPPEFDSAKSSDADIVKGVEQLKPGDPFYVDGVKYTKTEE